MVEALQISAVTFAMIPTRTRAVIRPAITALVTRVFIRTLDVGLAADRGAVAVAAFRLEQTQPHAVRIPAAFDLGALVVGLAADHFGAAFVARAARKRLKSSEEIMLTFLERKGKFTQPCSWIDS